MKTFDRIEDMTEFFKEYPFVYPSETSYFDGKLVLTPCRLNPEESARFNTIKRAYGSASTKHILVGGIKESGVDAVEAVHKASKGNIFGAISSLLSMAGKGRDRVVNDTISIADQNDDYKAYEEFEQAFITYCSAGYQHVKQNINPQKTGPVKRLIGKKEGYVMFMMRV